MAKWYVQECDNLTPVGTTFTCGPWRVIDIIEMGKPEWDILSHYRFRQNGCAKRVTLDKDAI